MFASLGVTATVGVTETGVCSFLKVQYIIVSILFYQILKIVNIRAMGEGGAKF